MTKHNQLRALLVEILIAVLFFALSATTLLEVFVGAHTQSVRAEVTNEALFAAQNLADRLYSAEDAEALLTQDGFLKEENAWTLDCGAYALAVTLGEERAAGGAIRSAQVLAQYGEDTLLSLPSVRYTPEEVRP